VEQKRLERNVFDDRLRLGFISQHELGMHLSIDGMNVLTGGMIGVWLAYEHVEVLLDNSLTSADRLAEQCMIDSLHTLSRTHSEYADYSSVLGKC